jgi:hypothetical protein
VSSFQSTDTRRSQTPRVNAIFRQSVAPALERAVLYLFRHLPANINQQLARAIEQVRCDLDLPFPPPVLSYRDWPKDSQAGDALHTLLVRLDEMDALMSRWRIN